MKNLLIILAITLFIFACDKVDPNPLEAINGENLVVDVRTPQEFNDGHLKDAINIPYTVISDQIAAHVENKDETIIVYCRSGRRSSIAKSTLEKIGYTNVLDAGSYQTLKEHEKRRNLLSLQGE